MSHTKINAFSISCNLDFVGLSLKQKVFKEKWSESASTMALQMKAENYFPVNMLQRKLNTFE